MTGDPGRWDEIEQAGAGAIVLPSLFEEQIERDSFAIDATLDHGTDSFAEALSYLPDSTTTTSDRLAISLWSSWPVSGCRFPVIASLNGTTPGGWVRYARHLETPAHRPSN